MEVTVMMWWRCALVSCVLTLVACGGGGGGGDEDTATDEDVTTDTGDVEEEDGLPDGVECASDEDCDDGVFCNGEETCDGGSCADGTEPCDDDDPCTLDVCDEGEGICDNSSVDSDEDGYPAAEVDSVACTGTDCDDDDDAIHPGAAPDCAGGGDFDCDGNPDDDEDGDGFGPAVCGGDDCDDENEDAWPGNPYIGCAAEDLDCNGYEDHDNDGDGDDRVGCGAGGDCDDENPLVSSLEVEINCSGLDEDCNGEMSLTEDADQDGFANAGCVAAGMEVDCDDTDDASYPGATELCDEVDQDCDGTWADGGADDDADTVLDVSCGGDDCDDTNPDAHPGIVSDCQDFDADCDGDVEDDQDGDGHLAIACGGDDCDDDNDDAYPGNGSDCQMYDADCDGDIEIDQDGDTISSTACYGLDCDDTDASIYPGATPATGCETVDVDCDGAPENDGDDDGYVDVLCGGDDCDDQIDYVNPGMTPACEAADTDCDTLVDNDRDADGHVRDSCPSGDDCDDSDPDISPSDPDICLDGVDNDCDGIVDGPMPMMSDDIIVSGGGTTTTNGSMPDIVWTGSQYTIVYWSDWGMVEDHDNIVIFNVEAGGALLFGSDNSVTDDVDFDWDPSLAWSGSHYGLAWGRLWGPSPHTSRGTSFTSLDMSFDHSDPVEIADEGFSPSIVWNGSDWTVCWDEDYTGATGNPGHIVCNRFDDDGTALGVDTVVAESGDPLSDEDPSVIWTGSGYGLLWIVELGYSPTRTEAMFRWVEPDFSTTGSMVNVSEYPASQSFNPRFAWSGSQFAVTWADSVDDFATADQVFRIVNPDGTFATTIEDVPGGTTTMSILGDVVWTGSTWGFAWTDGRVSVSNGEIYYRVFEPDGTPLTGDARITDASYESNWPELVWTGSEVGMTWEDDRFSPSTPQVFFQRIGFCD